MGNLIIYSNVLRNKYIIGLPIIFFILIVLSIPAHSEQMSDSSHKRTLTDTLPKASSKDSLKKLTSSDSSDSLKKHEAPKDTVKPFIPLKTHGSIFLLKNKNSKVIRKEDIQFDVYNGFTELLSSKLPFYPLFLGSPGLFNSFSAFGGTSRDVSLTFNGRPVTDMAFGSFNLEQFSPEFMEKTEILTGSDAVIFSDNSSGFLANIQEVRYNTAKPYTKLWYEQAGYDFIAADGIFSQNPMKNVNFTFGFHKTTSKGRYKNSWLDSWNVRALLRWNLSDRTNVSLTENFFNHGIGTNGGVNLDKSSALYDELAAEPNYEFNNERVFRHDLTATLTSYLDKDSSQAVLSNAFFTYSEWNKYRPVELTLSKQPADVFLKFLDRQKGFNIRYESRLLNNIIMRFGGELNHISLGQSDYNEGFNGLKTSTFAQTQLDFIPGVELSGGLRYVNMGNHNTLNVGAHANISLSDVFILYGDVSRSERFPSMSESLTLKNEKSFLEIAGIKLKVKESIFELGVFARQTTSPILAIEQSDSTGLFISTYSYNGNNRNVIGANLNISSRFFSHLIVRLWGQSYLVSKTDDADDKRFPKIFGGLNTYYEIIAGQSILNIGVSFSAMTKFNGETFIPQTRSYIPNAIESTNYINGLDAFATARLGNAFVRLSYQNVLSNGYYYVPFYPALDRNFRLMFSWAFLN